MVYFFAKQEQFVQCEIHPGRPHVFRVIDAEGQERIERYSSVGDLEKRWHEVAAELTRNGWSGPFGRDGRA